MSSAIRKIMVTGAGGFLGRHLSAALRESGYETLCFDHSQLDITDKKRVESVVNDCHPDIVVHCAAISSTSYAKEHPDEAFLINVTGSTNVAAACKSAGAGLFVMSSDQVYGGCSIPGPLSENLELSPNNTYGEQKLLMEKKVLDILPDAVALRLSWMFEAFKASHTHEDIIAKLTRLRESGEIKASTREYRGMTDVDVVCRNIIRAFGNLEGGVYNFGAGNESDTFTTLREVARRSGIPEDRIVPDDSWGRNLSMDCRKAARFGIYFPSTIDGISI